MSDKGSTTVEFAPGDLLIQEKTAASAIYIIKSGQLEVYKTNKAGEKIPIGIINSGEYVGEAAMLLDKTHTSNVVALTKVLAVRISKEALKKQLETAPKWFVQLTRGLIHRLHHGNELLRKHGIVDEKMVGAIKAIGDKNGGDESQSA